MLKLNPERQHEGNIIPLDWTPLKRLARFPPTFGQNVTVLVASLLGILSLTVYEWYRRGMTPQIALALALLAALSAATTVLIYQERRSWASLKELRTAIGKIAPTYSMATVASGARRSTEALEGEIRALTERWKEFCDHCQRLHESQMLHAEHLASMGELAAGVAHEIRNPLAGIAGAIEIITKDFPPDHPDREILDDLRQEVRRIEKVLNDLLAYARPKPPQFGTADLKEVVARTLQFARQQTGAKRVEFSIQVPGDLPHFRTDSEQLHQVLLNLVLNGIQALERDGRITIAARVNNSRAPGRDDLLEISIVDTGAGIPPEQMERIFRPFYTTKRGGTGLGLSLCRRIIRQQGGTLSVESEVGKGSRFIIRLPLREAVEGPKEVHAQRESFNR